MAVYATTASVAAPLIVDVPQDEVNEELLLESLVGSLETPRFILRRAPDGTLRPLGGLQVPETHRQLLPKPPRAPAAGLRTGSLSGKRIALVAGHGWLVDGAGWRTQRSRWDFTGCGKCRGITEDFFTSEFVSENLAPLVENMGAEIVFTREADHATDPAVTGTAKAATLPKGQVAEARYPLTFGSAGYRRAYARWVAGADRSTQTQMIVAHAGGETLVEVDQTQPGSFYRSLGRFWFPASGGSLRWASMGAAVVSTDVIKVGGGMHPSSQKPWWQMGAATYVPWAGAGSSVTQYGDVSIRPAYAESLDIDAYISIHANASGAATSGTASGTSVYRYSCQQYEDFTLSSAATGCDDPPGSRAFADAMQASIIDGLQGEWDPNWKDRSARVANFGEVRTLVDAPGVLIETAFFDNIDKGTAADSPKYADNRSLHDPRFREALARAVARGIAQLFVPGAPALPDRPHGLIAQNQADGTVRVSWQAVPGAAKYRLYRIAELGSDAAQAWDDGAEVSGTSVVVDDLIKDSTYAFRVAATNTIGEGYASAAVVLRARGVKTEGQAANVLVVHGYDRRDAWVQNVDNDLTATLAHGGALGTLDGVYFDGALDDAVPALAGYALVDLACGKDSIEHDSVAPALLAPLTAHVKNGGALIVSGEEVAYDLSRGSAAEKAFLSDVLHAGYAADDAGTKTVAGVGPFSGFGLDDGSHGSYAVTYPDVITGDLALKYDDGRGAAVFSGGVFFAGFGLETIVTAVAREKLYAAIIAAVQLPPPSPQAQTKPEKPKPDPTPEEPTSEPDPTPTPTSPSAPAATSPPVERAGCACSEGGGARFPIEVIALFFLWRRRRLNKDSILNT